MFRFAINARSVTYFVMKRAISPAVYVRDYLIQTEVIL